jgi:hypothetical protein
VVIGSYSRLQPKWPPAASQADFDALGVTVVVYVHLFREVSTLETETQEEKLLTFL